MLPVFHEEVVVRLQQFHGLLNGRERLATFQFQPLTPDVRIKANIEVCSDLIFRCGSTLIQLGTFSCLRRGVGISTYPHIHKYMQLLEVPFTRAFLKDHIFLCKIVSLVTFMKSFAMVAPRQ